MVISGYLHIFKQYLSDVANIRVLTYPQTLCYPYSKYLNMCVSAYLQLVFSRSSNIWISEYLQIVFADVSNIYISAKEYFTDSSYICIMSKKNTFLNSFVTHQGRQIFLNLLMLRTNIKNSQALSIEIIIPRWFEISARYMKSPPFGVSITGYVRNHDISCCQPLFFDMYKIHWCLFCQAFSSIFRLSYDDQYL